MKFPRRGEVYLVNLDPTVGKEIRKTRPALIIQTDTYNRYSATTVVVPITSNTSNPGPSKVLVTPPEGGLKKESVILLKQIRVVDKRRLLKRLGKVESQTLRKVDAAMVACFISA